MSGHLNPGTAVNSSRNWKLEANDMSPPCNWVAMIHAANTRSTPDRYHVIVAATILPRYDIGKSALNITKYSRHPETQTIDEAENWGVLPTTYLDRWNALPQLGTRLHGFYVVNKTLKQ